MRTNGSHCKCRRYTCSRKGSGWRQSRRWKSRYCRRENRDRRCRHYCCRCRDGTRCSAHGGIIITSAVLKRPAAHCSVVASVSVGLQRERAHSGIIGSVVVVDQGGCSKGAVPCARGVEQKGRGAHCRIGICIVEDQRSGANASVVIAGASSKQRIPANSCISSPAGEVTQRVASFRRRETRDSNRPAADCPRKLLGPGRQSR